MTIARNTGINSLIRIIRVLYEEEGMQYNELRNIAQIINERDFIKSLQFLIDINFIKRVKGNGNNFKYFLINRNCPLIQKFREANKEINGEIPKDL